MIGFILASIIGAKPVSQPAVVHLRWYGRPLDHVSALSRTCMCSEAEHSMRMSGWLAVEMQLMVHA
jgi:hypothetical protein